MKTSASRRSITLPTLYTALLILPLAWAQAAPTITFEPVSITAVVGTTATFTVVADGTGTLNYRWQLGGAYIEAQTTESTLTLNNVSDSQAGLYTVVVTDTTGSITSSPPAILTVLHPPVIASQPQSQVVLDGDDAYLYVGANSASTPATLYYQWEKAGTAIPGETDFDLDLYPASSSDAGSYSVIVTNVDGSAMSSNALLTVIEPQLTQSVANPVNTCTNVTFGVVTYGSDSTLAYQWYTNGTAVTGESSSTYTVSGVTFADAVTYSVDVSNSAGSFATASASMTVTDPPPVITDMPADIVTNTGPGNPHCGQVVTWTPPTASDNCSVTNLTSNFNPGDEFNVGTNIVTYTATDNTGQTTTNSFTVTVADTTPPTAVFNSISVQLDASGNYTLTPADIAAIASGSSDNCGIASTEVSPINLTYCDVGSAAVTLTLTDIHGNVTVSNATITVLGPTNVPSDVYVDASYGTCNGSVTFPSSGGSGAYYIGYNAFASIQAAISAVTNTGTVHVAAGTYSESVNASKPVTLLGANAGVTGCGARGPESVISVGVGGTAVNITVDNVTVDGFSLQGSTNSTGLSDSGHTNVTVQNNMIVVGALGLSLQNINGPFTVQNNCVTVTATELSPTQPAIGVLLAGISGGGAQVVQDNNVSGPLYGYLLADVSSSPALAIQGGSITGVMQGVAVINYNLALNAQKSSIFKVDGTTMSAFAGISANPNANLHAGLYVYTGGSDTTATVTATITNVTVTGTGKISPDSSGLDLADFSTGSGVRQQITVQNCNLSTNENRGVFASGSNAVAAVTGSSILGNGFDPYGAGGNPGFGIIARNNAQLTIANCFIANPATVTAPYTVTAVEADANTTPLGPTVVATDNLIVNNGNPSGYLAAQDAGTLNASGNWWGDTNDTAIAALMTGTVDFTPYLGSGTDTDLVTPGFQGDFSSLYVTALGAQTGATGRIQEGINTVTVGGTVNVEAGSYNENLSLNNWVTLTGAGSGSDPAINTVITSATANTPVITITSGGDSATERLVVSNLRVTGAIGSENPGSGIQLAAPGSYYTFDNVASVGNAGDGFAQNLGSGGNNDIVLSGCSFSTNGIAGFRVPTTGSIDGLTISNSHFDDNVYGMEVFMGNGSGSVFQNVNISGSTFNDNTSKGTYFEKLNNAAFSSLTMVNSGNTGANAAGFNINLKYGTYSDIVISNSDIIGCGTGDPLNGGGVIIEARGTGNDSSYAANAASLSGVTLFGLNVSGSLDGIRFGEPGKNNVGPTGVTIRNCNLAGNTSNGIHNDSQTLTDATSNWWGSISGPTGAANPYGTGVGVSGLVSFAPWLGDGTDTSPDVGFQPNATPTYNPPTQLVFTTQPGGALVGSLLSPQPVVSAEDTYGNVTPWVSSNITVVISYNPTGSGVLTGTAIQPASSGVAAFTDLAIAVDGGSNYTLSASAPSLPTAISSPFNIANPAPAITSLSPFYALAGGSAFCLTITGTAGTGFVADSVVDWNGSPRPTHYVSPTEITANISATDIASAGSVPVTVVNVAPGGGTSAPVNFMIVPAVPSVVYVDTNYTSLAANTLVNWPDTGTGTNIIGYDAFGTIRGGVNVVAANGTVNVAAGSYNERVIVATAGVTVQGAGTNSVVTGTTAAPGSDVTPAVFKVTATGVSINNFEILVDFAFNHSGVLSSGTCTGITVSGNTVIASASTTPAYSYGLRNAIAINPNIANIVGYTLDNIGYSGVTVAGNTIEGTGGTVFFRAGIQMDLCGGLITGNTSTTINHDFITRFANQGDITVSGNSFYGGGAQFGSFDPGAGTVIITNNLFDNSIMQPATGPIATGASLRLSYYAEVATVTNNVIVSGNTFQNHRWGVSVEDFENVTFDNNTFTPKTGSTDYIHMTFNTKIIESTSADTNLNMFPVGATLTRNTFNGSGSAGGTALAFYNHRSTDAVFGTYTIGTPGSENNFNAGISNFILLDGSSGPSSAWVGFGEYAGIPSTTMAPWATNLNAENNYFDVGAGLTLPGVMTLGQLFATEDSIYHKPDNAVLGFVRVKAANVYVTQNSGSIQRGVGAATEGDTVNVNAGTFTEQVEITNDIALSGQGTATVVQSPTTLPLYFTDSNPTNFSVSDNFMPVVYVHDTANASVQNLLVDGMGLGNANNRFVGVGYSEAGGSVSNLVVQGIRNNPLDGVQAGYGIRADANNAARSLAITDCTISDFQKNGIDLRGASLTGLVSGNTVTGVGPTATLAQNGIVILGATGTILNNNISAYNYTLAGNDPQNDACGILIYQGGATINNNSLTNCQFGVGLYDPLASMGAIAYNDFSGDGYGVNNFSDNSGPAFNAVSNWWGSASGPANNANPGATGVAASANVVFSPWLGDGTDTSADIGFQPNPTPVYYQPDHLVFSTQPGNAALNNPLSPQPVVQVIDANGGLATEFNGTVSLATGSNPRSGVLTGTTNVAVVGGTAPFAGLAITMGGGLGYTLTASSTSPIVGATSTTFDITNPVPALTGLSPFYARAGATGVTLTVNGSNFVPNSAVEWNGVPLTTTYVSGTRLTAAIPDNDLATPATASVVVSSPTPGGGPSGAMNFIIEPAQPLVVYVDTNYANQIANALVNWPYTGTGTNIIGYDAFGTIQGGINAVATNGTVNVAAGIYVEDVTANKPLNLLGPNADINPNTGSRLSEAVIQPATSGPNPNTDDEIVVYVAASQVTMKGFTVDGNNPLITSGILVGGVDVDAAEGIAAFDGVGSITIANNIVKNTTYSGVDFYNYYNGGAATSGNQIAGNLFSNMGTTNFGYGFAVLIYNNFYADISSNVMNQVRIGVQTGNFSQSNPGASQHQRISDNTIICGCEGIFHNLAYSGASTFTLSNNTIIAWPEPGFETYNREWSGIVILTIQGNVTATAINNVIDASASITNTSGLKIGYNIWNTPTTGAVTITGGSVSNANYGAWANNWDGYDSQGDSAHATISGVTIFGSSLAGIYVQDDPRSANGSSVNATVTDNTVITDSAIGVLVQGTNASASVISNAASITGDGIGIDVDTGKALIENNDLTGNTVAGIWATNGAVVDAGNCTGNNVTGLGISTGGNNLSGYLTTSNAIINANSGGIPVVLADHDNFGATSPSDIIPSAFTGAVEYSQTPAIIAPPTNVTVTCVGDVPAGASTLSEFISQGGYFSASAASVNFSDVTNLNGGDEGSGTIARTYTLADSCEVTTQCTQIITVSDTIPPVITLSPNIVQGVDPGKTYATVRFTNTADDNCDPHPVVVATPPSGSQFGVGTNTVTVVATDVSGNSSTNTFTVAVIALPGVTSEPQSRTNNAGTTATFTVVADSPAPLGYQWSKSGVGNIPDATNATLTLINVQDADVADYTVQVSNLAGNVLSAPAAHLTVIDPPVISSITPPSQTNNATTTAIFTVANTGTAPFSYQWTKITATATNVLADGGNITGSTSNVLTITNVLGADQAIYAVSIGNPAGNVTTNAMLVVNDPAIFSQPANATQVLGGTVSFSISAAGTAPLYFQWLEKNVILPGQTATNLIINGIADSDAGNFSVIISNSVGLVISSNAILTVTHPPVVTSQPTNLVVNQGSQATFMVSVSGLTPFSYQWLKNGVPVTAWLPATGYKLILGDVMASDDGNYSVTVTNLDGGTISSNALLTVIVPPVITSQPLSLTNDAGTTAIFSVTNSGSLATCQWYQNGTNRLSDDGKISGSSTTVLIITNVLGADSATYDVVISNSANVATSSDATLVVIDPIITSQPVSQTNNLGMPASFSVAAYGTSPQYQWLKNGGVIPGATAATYPIMSVANTDVAEYSVIVSNAFGSITSTPPASLTVIDPPVITSTPASLTVNATSNATFTVGYTGTSPSFQWLKNGSPLNDAGNVSGATTPSLTLTGVQDGDQADYSVVLNNAANTVTSAPPATLTVIDPPVVTTEPVSLTVNAGQTATFSVGYTGTPPGFQWFKNDTNALVDGGNIHGANTATLTLSNVFGIDGADYKVVLANAAGSVTSAPPAILTVIDPVITGQPAGVTNIDGVSVEFTVSAIGTSPLNYQWFVDGYILDDETNSTLILDDIADSDAGDYTVVITNVYGCVTSTPAVLVTVPPLIVTQPASVVALVGQFVSFSVDVNGATPFSYQWQKNDQDIADETNSILLFANVQTTDAASYRVLVTNPLGMQMSDSATLTVYTNPVSLLTIGYSNNVASVGLIGLPGYNYAIQSSTNLLDWVPLQTNISPFTLQETNASGFTQRFYRGLYLP